mgnify:CR=1 FL=1
MFMLASLCWFSGSFVISFEFSRSGFDGRPRDPEDPLRNSARRRRGPDNSPLDHGSRLKSQLLAITRPAGRFLLSQCHVFFPHFHDLKKKLSTSCTSPESSQSRSKEKSSEIKKPPLAAAATYESLAIVKELWWTLNW